MSARTYAGPLAILITLYGLSVADFLLGGPIVRCDAALADAVRSLHTHGLDRVLAWISDSGGWPVVATLFAVASVALAALRRFGLIAGLWLTFAGKQITVAVLKDAFDRPRPDGASLASAAFPSGHAATSVALYGLLFWLGWHLRLLRGAAAIVAASIVALAIGFSRVYLGEHYLTDVLNGYVVGGLWLIAGATICTWCDRGERGAR